MTITINKDSVERTSCIIRIQRPLRWLMKQAYRLVYGGALHKDKDSLNEKEKSKSKIVRSSLTIKLSLEEAPEQNKVNDNPGASCENDYKSGLLELPIQIRQSIYDLIEVQDVLSLRLTCNDLKEDIETLHGLHVRIHDGRLDYDKLLRKFGISKLIIEQLVDESIQKYPILLHPQLLKALAISGSVSSKNLENVLRSSQNLMEWAVHYQYPDQEIHTSDFLKTLSLDSLKILHITSTLADISRLPSVRKSIHDVLNEVVCPNLSAFQVLIVGSTSDILQDYHACAQRFIRKNPSLEKINVELNQLEHTPTTVNVREDILLSDGWSHTGLKIVVLQLKMSSNLLAWYPLLDSQTCLCCLNLEMNGILWNRLILTLDRNARTLRSLVILGLCSTSQDGSTTVPVDLGLLRNLRALENLEVRQIDMEARTVESPGVLRTSSLPKSLKSVKLCHLRLKPHQAMFLLVKLPLLEELELKCWSDSEGTLAGYLVIVTFLIKFDITAVKSMALIDLRRKMENLFYEISRMRDKLSNEAAIVQTDQEVHTKLQITRYI